MRVAGRMLGSLLLGRVAILGSILIFRQGLLPLIEAVFHPGPERTSLHQTAASANMSGPPGERQC